MDKKLSSQAWLTSYVSTAGVIAAISIIPGTATVPLVAIQVIMSLHIGRIYRGENFTLEEAKVVCEHIGLTATIGRTIAYELVDLLPVVGQVIKSVVAGSATAVMGNMLINYYEQYDKSFIQSS